MRQAFDSKLRRVRLILNLSMLLAQSARVLTGAGVAALAILLADRLLALSWLSWPWGWPVAAVAAVALVVAVWRGGVGRMEAAVRLDQRLGLKERFSTALALSASEDPFAAAAVEEAHRRAESLSVRGAFPLRPDRRWIRVFVVGALLAGTILWMPQLDLLGRERRREALRQREREREQAKVQVREEVASVRSAVRQLGDPGLEEALANLDEPAPGAEPADVKREAIRKLGDVAEQLRQRRQSDELGAAEMLQNMLRRLRSDEEGFARDLSRALARGDAQRAAELVKELQKKVQEGDLSAREKEQISRQLQALAGQLREAAEKDRELRDELSRRGLEKSLAQLSEQDLREALRKRGLSEEQIDELMHKAAQCRAAAGQCSELAEAMAAAAGQAGELSAEDLAALGEQLDAMEAMLQDLQMTEATLAELERAMGSLGEGFGDYEGVLGRYGEFAEGLSLRPGSGTGGPGRGFGPRDTGSEEATETETVRTPNKPGGGPVVASWYYQGPQVKGEARRELGQVVQAARDRAAEAVSENRIPRRYEGAVKEYFRRLEGRDEEENRE